MMIKNNIDYIFIQEGSEIRSDKFDKISDYLSPKDSRKRMKRKGKRKNSVSNFVGFIITTDYLIISLPKNFAKNYDCLDDSSEADQIIYLLFEVFNKYFSSAKGSYVFNETDEATQSYPFIPFLKVWKWYKQYGLFEKNYSYKRMEYSGKINWKDTIDKSPKIINDGNLLFMPFVVEEKSSEHNFVSQCMAYVINKTLSIFPFALNTRPVHLDTSAVSFQKTEKIVAQLRAVKNSTYNNKELELINALIEYFSNENYEGVFYSLKIYYFEYLWEVVLEHFMKYYFLGIKDDYKLSFSNQKLSKSSIKFEIQEIFDDIDYSHLDVGYKIIPDFYSIADEDYVYIFDAKYYAEVTTLNYKQIAYHYFLSEEDRLTINYLLLPTAEENNIKKHFTLNKKYNKYGESFSVYEYYINLQEVLEKYIY